MASRLRISLSLIGLYALPAVAHADALVVPGINPETSELRPGYRQAAFPPPQRGFLGLPVARTGNGPRPTYRQMANQFPPAGGRYGGGFIEFLMTGGRPEPIAPQYAQPVYAPPAYAPAAYNAPGEASPQSRASLPQSGLPDYAPQPDAYYGAAPAASPMAYTGAEPVARDPGLTRTINPIYDRQLVAYSGRERPGTIVIDTPEKFLYLVQPGGQAIRYGIGVGRPGFSWAGVKAISRKAEWPGWTPPREMLARRPDLPRHMDGGEANPLGARALYLGSSLYRIHGTNEPDTIGTNVSSGCIRMMNQDVIDLYGRVGVGTKVIVL